MALQEIRAPVELVRQTKTLGRLPVVNFAAGGVATPADAALMMQLGMDGVFVGSGIFKSGAFSGCATCCFVRRARRHGLVLHHCSFAPALVRAYSNALRLLCEMSLQR